MADTRLDSLIAWDQRPNEGPKPYAAFRRYLEQGVEGRSIRKVAHELEKSETLIGRWASAHDWVERVSAWDRHMLDLVQAAIEDEVSEMAKRHANVAVAFQNKVVERLTEIKPADLSPAQLIQWFEVAARIERQARGLPDVSVANLPTADHERGPVDAAKIIELDEWLRAQDDGDDEEATGDA